MSQTKETGRAARPGPPPRGRPISFRGGRAPSTHSPTSPQLSPLFSGISAQSASMIPNPPGSEDSELPSPRSSIWTSRHVTARSPVLPPAGPRGAAERPGQVRPRFFLGPGMSAPGSRGGPGPRDRPSDACSGRSALYLRGPSSLEEMAPRLPPGQAPGSGSL